jgi:hypothetical protein
MRRRRSQVAPGPLPPVVWRHGRAGPAWDRATPHDQCENPRAPHLPGCRSCTSVPTGKLRDGVCGRREWRGEKGRYFFTDRANSRGWVDVYPHNWMAPAWTAPSTTSWSPSPASQGRNQKRRPGSSPVYGGGGPCAAWWRGRPGSPFDLANAVDSRDKPENDGRTSASPTKKRGQGLAFHSSGTSPNLTAPPPASSAG